MKRTKDSLNLSWGDTKALNDAITRWEVKLLLLLTTYNQCHLFVELVWEWVVKSQYFFTPKSCIISVSWNYNQLQCEANLVYLKEYFTKLLKTVALILFLIAIWKIGSSQARNHRKFIYTLFDKLDIQLTYRIFMNSFRGNYSFLNSTLHASVETIQGRKLFLEIR
jgi:hypothetical protein